jgi:hypothetical protein
MSVRQLATFAVARDKGQPTNAKRKAISGPNRAQVSTGNAPVTAAGAGDALVAAIPTEPLGLYTGLTSGITALFATNKELSSQYLPLRWWIFGVSTLVVALWIVGSYVAQRDPTAGGPGSRRLPVPEVITASAAFAAWALVMPGSPLRAELSGTSATVVTLCLTFGGATFVYLLAQMGLTKPSKIAPRPA